MESCIYTSYRTCHADRLLVRRLVPGCDRCRGCRPGVADPTEPRRARELRPRLLRAGDGRTHHPRQGIPMPTIVPYTTRWSAERKLQTPVIARPGGTGIAFADEILSDRDRHGALWQRMPSRPGHGRPEFGKVHSGRQRRAMRNLLCQVCAGPADRDDRGTLWLLPD